MVSLASVRLRPPIPEPPSVRDSLCFLDHMRNCQDAMGGSRVLKDAWYRIPAFYFANPAGLFGPYDEVTMAPGSAWQDFELEIVWAGPIANWIAACDTMLALDAATVVPGHGPLTDGDGIRAVRGYLEHITVQADAAYGAELSFWEAAEAIDLGPYADWLDAERVVVNVYQRYRELGADMAAVPVAELLVLQAQWHAKRG